MSTRKPQANKLHSGMSGNGGARSVRNAGKGNIRPARPINGRIPASYSQRMAGNTTKFYRDER